MSEILSKIADLSFIASFIAPIVGGEMAVIALAFLAAQGGFHLWVVIIFSFFGMVTIDSFWFGVMRSPWASRVKNWMKFSESYAKLEQKVESFSHRSDIIILLISKILVGTRILILIYLSLRKISFPKFFGYNSIATFIWAIALGYFGWFAGFGYYNVAEVYDNVIIAAFTGIGIIAIFYIILHFLRTWIAKR